MDRSAFMRRLGNWLKRSVRSFGRNRSGNVALMFGISVIPLLAAIGVGVDYGRVIDVRTKLNGAADAATLAALSKKANPFVITPTQAKGPQYFNALAANVLWATVSGVTITSVQATITQSVSKLIVTLNYTVQVKT